MSRLGFLLFAICSLASAQSAAEIARSIREAGLDPNECYRVRDFRFQREDIRIYFSDGYLIFSKPIGGDRHAAVFTTDVEGGDGEVLLLPPTRGERQSMALFTQSANLDEHFRAALMIFTGSSMRALIDRLLKDGSAVKAPERGALIADQWSPVLANVQGGFEIRMIEDLLTPPPDDGMLFFALNGKQSGNFDLIFDPRAREQIVAGQLAERNGRLNYNIWTSFTARSARNAQTPPKPEPAWFTLSNFRIDAAFDADLRMNAVTKVHVKTTRQTRVFPFDISQSIRVVSAKVDGQPAELFRQDSLRTRALRGSDNDVFLVTTPSQLAAGTEHEFEFAHEGEVVTNIGNRIYFVSARNTWYPHAGDTFATYDLTFRYPRRLTLVAPGDVADDRPDGDLRITRWRTPSPIRMAGFNLGEYEKISASAGGFKVDVYGNKNLPASLQPKISVGTIVQPPYVIHAQGANRPVTVSPSPPDPIARLHEVATDVAASLEFYSSHFGPPALKTLTVAPIPATFGQGFPGLVYLSTLSYLDPASLPPSLRDPSHELFFSDLMEAHEVAHQWWGNVVIPAAYQDEWLLEALANYSALMWLEKHRGSKAVDTVLEGYRDSLTQKDPQGHEVDSAGPIVWGTRLESSAIPDAWRTITYDKGAWIFHMLRQRMGDERFLKMLAELRHRYEFRGVSTGDVRALVKEFMPPKTPASVTDTFFDNWVYSTGVPSVKLKYTVKGAAPKFNTRKVFRRSSGFALPASRSLSTSPSNACLQKSPCRPQFSLKSRNALEARQDAVRRHCAFVTADWTRDRMTPRSRRRQPGAFVRKPMAHPVRPFGTIIFRDALFFDYATATITRRSLSTLFLGVSISINFDDTSRYTSAKWPCIFEHGACG